jgi:hypothetical protein
LDRSWKLEPHKDQHRVVGCQALSAPFLSVVWVQQRTVTCLGVHGSKETQIQFGTNPRPNCDHLEEALLANKVDGLYDGKLDSIEF